MNYADIQELIIHQNSPAVSLYIACDHQRGCMSKINQQCIQAATQVRRIYDNVDGENLAKILEALPSSIAVKEQTKSIVLFVNRSLSWSYALPYEAGDHIFVSDHFIIEEIIQHLAHAVRYWVLVLFHGKPFLFEGYENTISEVVHRHNTWTGGEYIDLNDLAGRVCAQPLWRTNCRYSSASEFIKSVDEGLMHFIEADPLPLVCCADEKNLEEFRKNSYYADRVLLWLPIDRLRPSDDLQRVIGPLFQKSYAHLRQEMLVRLREACKAHVCARGVSAVWRALHEGRAQFICLTRNYSEEICELPELNALVHGAVCHDGYKKDGVELLAKVALHKGVPLCWYEDPSALQEFSYVAAIVSSGDQETPASS